MSKFFLPALLFLQLISLNDGFSQTILKLPFEKKIGPDEGLSSYNANKILEDKFGFIWIATQDGLNRYDGNQFNIYNKSTVFNHRLLGNTINDIVEDTVRNILWVTTSYGGVNGISLISGNVIHDLKCVIGDNSFHNGWLKCFSICKGKLWIGTSDGLTVYDPDTKNFVHIEPLPFKKDSTNNQLNINSVVTDRFNNIWIYLPGHGIALYSGITNKILRYFTNDQLGIKETQGYVQLLCRFQRIDLNTYVLATDHGFNFFGYDSLGQIKKLPQTGILNSLLKDKYILSCTSDKNGVLWFSTVDDLYKFDFKNEKYEIVQDIGRKEQGNWLSIILYIFFDSHNNLWIGNGKGIAFSRNISPPFIPYSQSKDAVVKINHANYIYPLNDSLIYVCGINGFYKVKTTTDEISQLENFTTNYVFKNIDNKYIVSSINGLLVENSGKLYPVKNIYPELFKLSNEIINSSIIIGDSIVFMASETEKGIYIWHFKKHVLDHFTMNENNSENTAINYIYKNSKNEVFILFDNSIAIFDLHKYNYKRFQINDPELKIPLNILFDICEVKNNYWLAIYGKGVVQMDQDFTIKKIYSLNNGLLNTGVYKVIPYKDSLIFVTSNNGLYSINISTQQISQYLKDDGLNTNNFEERCGFIQKDSFFVGGSNGFTIVIPSFIISKSSTPQLYVDDFKVQFRKGLTDTFNLHFQNYTIPNDALQTTISFSALNYANPERVTYEYRIKENSDKWISLGTQNFINLIGLSPGTYTLEVKAANEDAVWSEPKKIMLTFLPKWYQTLWFDFLVALAAASLIYSFYRFRLMQIRKQHQIRKEIASDLHDDIGATLNSVKIFSHLAETSNNKQKYFDNIKEALTYASTGLRDMIWVLDDTGDTITDLVNRLKMFAYPVAEASGISIRIAEDPSINNVTLSKTEKRNLLLIAKEAINNSIKYSGCEKITVTFFREHNKNTLIIEDDGKGFNESEIVRGNGLNNIQERAKQIHYNISLKSSLGKGTRIVIARK